MIPNEKVQAIVARHDILEKELSTGEVDPKTFADNSREYSNLGNIIKYARDYLNFDKEKKDLEQILNDSSSDKDMSLLAEKELTALKNKKIYYENKLKIFLLPKDADDNKNAIVEIRAGTGGLEASLFVQIYLRCMKKFAQKKSGN